ncbi:hypothetical protein JCM8547_000154 [Rhodosporidiobolus lusitaniae]
MSAPSPSTKDTLRQLLRLFSPSSSSSSSSQPSSSSSSAPPALPSNPFPAFTLPPSLLSLLDTHIVHFASLPLPSHSSSTTSSSSTTAAQPSSSTPAAQLTEGERERLLWRTGLLEIWAAAEPSPGTERDLSSIGRVSAFLVLLDKLSADVGEDDDSAIVSRRDIGGVWWKAVLRRTMLGTAKDEGAAEREKREKEQRGRKPTRKGKEPDAFFPPSPSSSGTATPLPLFVSRAALSAASRTVVWGMSASRQQLDEVGDSFVSPFALVILNEYEDRALARLKGLDEGYGVKNLEECLVSWGDKAPKAFFTRLSPHLTPSTPSLLPTLSLLLSFLSRHSTKTYHALSTPLLSNLITTALTSPCAAVVTLAVKCLVIVVVTLPIIVGEEALLGIFAVYGRVAGWEEAEMAELARGGGGGAADPSDLHGLLPSNPPSPLSLFTVLYGIYPLNFTSFLRNAAAYLREKGWKGPLGDGDFGGLSAGAVRERSEPLLRLHTLHPSLFTSDAFSPSASSSELSDTSRWTRLEAADVMALCDRNVVQLHADLGHDWRGEATGAPAVEGVGGSRSGRGWKEEEEHGSIPPLALDTASLPVPSQDLPTPLPSPSSPLSPLPLPATSPSSNSSSAAPTPKPSSPPPSRPPSRAVSKARAPSAASSSASTTSPSRPPQHASTPHMPATTHFANFQALQQYQQQGSPLSNGGMVSPLQGTSPLVRPRSVSRFRTPGVGGGMEEMEGGGGGVNMSRRGSGVGSILGLGGGGGGGGVAAGLLSPELVPFGRVASSSSQLPSSSSLLSHPSPHAPFPPSSQAQHQQAQLTKLETELVLLQSEVHFQGYLKQLHLQHMGTLHREKVLESGAEAERQSSFRTIRTLRSQLLSTQSTLDRLRSEQAATKSNWTAHIADLREKLGGLREQRVRWEREERRLREEVRDWRERWEKGREEGEREGRDFLDLRNQVQLDAVKLSKIHEYEHRIQALTKTLAICDSDIVKFVEQRKEMQLLVGEWRKSEMVREALEEEGQGLREALRTLETELALLRHRSPSPSTSSPLSPFTNGHLPVPASMTAKDDLTRMRAELARLRSRNLKLEERLADKLDDEEDEDGVGGDEGGGEGCLGSGDVALEL